MSANTDTTREFVPYHWFDKDATALTVYVSGDADYAQQLTDGITVYRSLETNEVVGLRVDLNKESR